MTCPSPRGGSPSPSPDSSDRRSNSDSPPDPASTLIAPSEAFVNAPPLHPCMPCPGVLVNSIVPWFVPLATFRGLHARCRHSTAASPPAWLINTPLIVLFPDGPMSVPRWSAPCSPCCSPASAPRPIPIRPDTSRSIHGRAGQRHSHRLGKVRSPRSPSR